MYQRSLQTLVKMMLEEFRIVYLTGPRQAGKTTLVREMAEQSGMRYLTLDDQGIRAAAENDPHGLIRSLAAHRCVIDEFQYVPELIPAIKEASDRLKPGQTGRFLLTGSADIFRSARVQEALPGHMARLELYPLSLRELTGRGGNRLDGLLRGDCASLDSPGWSREDTAEKILAGGYPEAQGKSDRGRQIWFRSYVEGRLLKDFETLHEARGDYASRLRALVSWLAGRCGNLLKYASAGTDLELDDRLVKTYTEVLELMFIVHRVPSWRKNCARREAVRMPKLHFVDTGLACHLLGLLDVEQLWRSQHYGGLLENLVFLELLKQSGWSDEPVGLFHFRDRTGREVDVVLENSRGGVTGVEVKASATVEQKDFRGLKALAEIAGGNFERGVVFYTGREVLPFHEGDLQLDAVPISFLTE